MRRAWCVLFLSIGALLPSPGSLSANTALEVDERATRLNFDDKKATVSLSVNNPGKGRLSAQVRIEILDPRNVIVAGSTTTASLETGANTVRTELEVHVSDGLLWNRVRYSVAPLQPSDARPVEGVISASEITPDIFSLKIIKPGIVDQGRRCQFRVLAAHPVSSRPLVGVQVSAEVEFEELRTPLKAEGVTDAEGYSVFSFDLPQNLKSDGDISVTGSRNGLTDRVDGSLRVNRTALVSINTDKTLYQPGQPLHVRAILFDPSKRAMPAVDLMLKIFDADDSVVYRATMKTSRFGVASADWAIPANARLGDYTIRISQDTSDEENLCGAWRKIRISRYELPNFSVAVKPDRNFYLPNQNAEVEVRGDYLFGQPVTRGRVRVVRETEREWNYREQKWEITEEEKYEGDLNAAGRFVAKVDLRKEHDDLSSRDYARIRDVSYAAYLTDLTTNRTEQRRFSLRVSKEPIHVYLIEDDMRAPGMPLFFYVSTFYADGAPAECDVDISQDDLSEAPVLRNPHGKYLRTVKTNRYGVAKVSGLAVLPLRRPLRGGDDIELSLTARDRRRRFGHHTERIWFNLADSIHVETDKAIYRPGEPIRVDVVSMAQEDQKIFLDVLQGLKLVRSQDILISGGHARMALPYSADFNGAVTVLVYGYPTGSDFVAGARTVLYPQNHELMLDLRMARADYRPGQDASAEFQVATADGKGVESALGVSVVDKSVEERARTDSDFGDQYGFARSYERLWGSDQEIAGVTRASLDRLIPSTPITPELQLVAEVLLRGSGRYFVDVDSGDRHRSGSPSSVFEKILKSQLKPIEGALASRYARTGAYPRNQAMLIRELADFGLDFANMRDPWGSAYSARASVNGDRDVLTVRSAGPDKRLDTADDFTVLEMGWPYFRSKGRVIDRAVLEYHKRTGAFIRDRLTLARELRRSGINIDTLRDPWGMPYRYSFGISANNFTVTITSSGVNRRFELTQYHRSDDIPVWTSKVDYFAEKRARIDAALTRSFAATGRFPQQESELEEALRDSAIRLKNLRDPWGNRYYSTFKSEWRFGDRVKLMSFGKFQETARQRTEVTPVSQQVSFIYLRSVGMDGQAGTSDDFSVGTFARIVAEKSAQDLFPVPPPNEAIFMGSTGAISGVVTDMSGAVITNATVKATNSVTLAVYEGKTNDTGTYLVTNVPAGLYEVRIESTGFKPSVITAVPVRSSSVTEVNVTLNVGSTAETANVTASAEGVQVTSETVSKTVSAPAKAPIASVKQLAQASTPRLREYFPETLVWRPSIETDAGGHARLNFKLADNITTWKMEVIASTEDGQIGTAETEILAFQPFFVEHDPPRVLTEGDEIALPVVLRNYLDKPQTVDLEIKPEPWFTLLTAARRKAEVTAGEASRQVFEFRATTPIDDGKQRVSAVGSEASDAIERVVSVHPFGEEKTDTLTQVFSDSSTIQLNIPDAAIKGTPRGELKIYPNLMAHLLEGVEGIMRRPYGCAEQTISSAYPSLMVLRCYKRSGDESPTVAEKARKYVKAGYERLLNYRHQDGGFTYWGRGDSDAAVTAYALRFLIDARDFIDVDDHIIDGARDWIVKRLGADGGWALRYSYPGDRPQRASLTAFVARVLASTTKTSLKEAGDDLAKRSETALKRALEFLRRATEEMDEPYAIASYALAAASAGDEQGSSRALARLTALAHNEGGASYWALEANTPFYGWGLAGRIEATALAVQALAVSGKGGAARGDLVNRGLLFLLRQKDAFGVWYSTQATVNVLDALVTILEKREVANTSASPAAEIVVNDKRVASVDMPPANKLTNPISFDLSPFLSVGTNRIQILRAAGSPQATVQVVATHYEPWSSALPVSNAGEASEGALRLRVGFDKNEAKIGDEINCTVEAERVGFRGYGMMLAEIGLPPGADVDRASLERAVKESDWGLDQYDVLPDRLIVYLWPRSGGARFQFKLRPRFGVAAQTAPSVVYDYYNPEARAVLTPTKFVVK